MVVARPSEPYPDMSWSGWGDPSQVPALPESVRRLLREGLGVRRPAHPPPHIEEVSLPPSVPHPDAFAALAGAIGPENALADDEARLRHTRGKSTPDLLRMRAGETTGAPDLVLLPGSHEEVLAVLRICSERGIAVVPFGGGTSVVGGLEPPARMPGGVVALDLRRMNALLELDEVSRLATLEPGLRAPQAEALLGERGFTIGHFPQSFEYATLGGFAAARSSGQASPGYGRFDELVLALEVATPAGTLALGRAPRSAAGPDLRQLVLGSEGTLGVITALTLQVRPVPGVRVYEGWRLPSFAAGIEVLRGLAQGPSPPTVLRLSDEAETAMNLARPEEVGRGDGKGGCLAIVGFEGTAEEVSLCREEAGRVLAAAGAQLDSGAGETWDRQRYRGPYLRDALLEAGALVETLETAAFWSGLKELYEAVSRAIREALESQRTPPIVLCHISHVYPAGASLYFTVGCAQAEDPVAQWRSAKAAAGEAILAAGGTITHHHGIGVDHKELYGREIGEVGVRILRSIKATVDPAGILNPGVLVP